LLDLPLYPPSRAVPRPRRIWSPRTTIRYREGKRLLTDGPFAETREHLGGYTIIEAKDLDEAIALASGFVGTSGLESLEVRPLLEAPGVPVSP